MHVLDCLHLGWTYFKSCACLFHRTNNAEASSTAKCMHWRAAPGIDQLKIPCGVQAINIVVWRLHRCMRLLYTIHFTFKEGFRVCSPSNEPWELCESKRDPGMSHPETRNSQCLFFLQVLFSWSRLCVKTNRPFESESGSERAQLLI